MNPLPVIPVPFVDGLGYIVAIASILVGAALVVWGRLLGRPLVMIALAGIGYACGGPLAQAIAESWGKEVPPGLLQFGLAFVGFILGFVAERFCWGLLAGGLIAVPILAVILASPVSANATSPLAAPLPVDQGTGVYLQEAAGNFLKALEQHWSDSSVKIILAGGLPLLLCLVLAFVRPRLIRILMSCLLGGSAILFGLVLALTQMLIWMWAWNWENWYVPCGLALVVAIVGMVVQIRTSLKLDSAEREREESAKKAVKAAKDKGEALAN